MKGRCEYEDDHYLPQKRTLDQEKKNLWDLVYPHTSYLWVFFFFFPFFYLSAIILQLASCISWSCSLDSDTNLPLPVSHPVYQLPISCHSSTGFSGGSAVESSEFDAM